MRCAIMLVGCLALLAAAAEPPAERTASLEDYRLIVTRNIFARDRTIRTPPRFPPVRPPQPGPSRDSYLVLRGVTVQGDLQVAFFENSQTGETSRLTVGESLGDGGLISIWLSGVEYRSHGVSRQIAVGENLLGAATVMPPVAPTTTSAASEPTSGPSEAASRPGDGTGGGLNDILERMRQRRLREGN